MSDYFRVVGEPEELRGEPDHVTSGYHGNYKSAKLECDRLNALMEFCSEQWERIKHEIPGEIEPYDIRKAMK